MPFASFTCPTVFASATMMEPVRRTGGCRKKPPFPVSTIPGDFANAAAVPDAGNRCRKTALKHNQDINGHANRRYE
jgi:hypothetical protein